MNKSLFRASIVAIIIIGAIVGDYIYNNLSKRPEFSAYQVAKGEISEVLDVSGKIKSENSADLGFEIGGRITALNYKVGDSVKRGTILARSNDADLQSNYLAAIAQVKSAKATLDQLDELKKKEKYDLKALKSPNNTANDKKAQKEQIDASDAAVEAQEAQVTALENLAQSARAEVDKTIIQAPYDGIISRQDVEVGETFQSGTPIITLINKKEFKIELFVSEIDAKKIQVGDAAEITIDSQPGVSYSANVTAVDPAETLINNVSNYKITLHFDQNSSDFISGTDANVHIDLEKLSDVLAVPKSAIFQENDKTYVYISRNGLRQKQEISVGIYGDNDMVEIVSGLSEGDTIFLVK